MIGDFEDFKTDIDDIRDFPQKGVVFRDITPLLSRRFSDVIDSMQSLFSDKELEDIEAFAGLDARGFIFAGALAERCGKQMIPIRKSGKIPPPFLAQEYELEYGKACVEVKPGSARIAIVDDLLATGGSMQAAAQLCQRAGYEIMALACLIDLTFLNDFEWQGHRVRSVLQYSDNES